MKAFNVNPRCRLRLFRTETKLEHVNHAKLRAVSSSLSRNSHWRHQACPATGSCGIPSLSPLPLSRNLSWRYPPSLPLSRQLQRRDCPRRHVPPGEMAVPISHSYSAVPVPLLLLAVPIIPPLALAAHPSRQCQWRHPRKKQTPSAICYK